MNTRKLTAVGMCALALTAIASAERYEFVTRTHMYIRGGQTYSVGYGSGGAQHGLFYVCKGKGRLRNPKEPNLYSYNECVEYEHAGDGGAWLNSPDGRFFYIQDLEGMGSRIFELVDIVTQDLVPNLKVPSVPMRDGFAAYGPDPGNGEAGFSNSGDTFLAVVPRVGRTELLIYDRVTPSAWALRRSLPLDASFSGVYPVDKARALLWTRAGNLRLYDIENNRSLWAAKLHMLVDDMNSTHAKVVVVSPSLQFALFVSELGSALVAVGSGAVVANYIANNQQLPSMICTDKWPDTFVNSLPRSPGRCGQLLVSDDGSASVILHSGATLRLAR